MNAPNGAVALHHRHLGTSVVDFPVLRADWRPSLTLLQKTVNVFDLHHPGAVVIRRFGRFCDSSLTFFHISIVQ